MRVVIGADHAGYHLKELVKENLIELGHEVIDKGTNSLESVDYPDYAAAVCTDIEKNGGFGILICGTGIGMSIAANKFPGIRAALAYDLYAAKKARQHNDANVLCLGGRVLGPDIATEIVQTFLNTSFEGGRHLRRIRKIEKIEEKYSGGGCDEE
ncbi:ribose 5-phosphate isomerase B [Coprothermobacter platensis]|uniref:ribose 5-phosphate isomerase B n=1 Tax=Coprothermobacter platensis TaxID=108819 RepID=UPI00036CA84D|nr:ribose 5-phosphate isomerase B [Coprothermobacter platensis]